MASDAAIYWLGKVYQKRTCRHIRHVRFHGEGLLLGARAHVARTLVGSTIVIGTCWLIWEANIRSRYADVDIRHIRICCRRCRLSIASAPEKEDAREYDEENDYRY